MATIINDAPTLGTTDYIEKIADLVTQLQSYMTELENARQGLASVLANLQATYVTYAVLTGGLLSTTSSTSAALTDSGSVSFTVPAGLAFIVGATLLSVPTADSTKSMTGRVTAYSGTTLTILMSAKTGSGTYTAWAIGMTGTASTLSGILPGTILANQTARVNSTATAVEGYYPPSQDQLDALTRMAILSL